MGSLTLGLAWGLAPVGAAPVDDNPQFEASAARGEQVLLDEQNAMTAIVQRVTPAVVHVEAEIGGSPSEGRRRCRGRNMPFPFGPEDDTPGPRGDRGLASGSGIIIDPNGTIVTNRHVVQDARNVTVTLTDHRSFRGTVYSDPNIDLAVIKVEAHDLPYVRLADTTNLHIGQFALAVGYPFDVGQTVTRGIISALGRSQTIEGQFYPNLIQTDAPINPGNSGGALVDLHGNVIGVNTAIAGEAGQSAGIGFAIPGSTVKLVATQLANAPHTVSVYPPGWRRGKLGVEVRPITPDLATSLGVDEGALIATVQPNGPGAQAGLQTNDVVTHVHSATVDVPVRDAEELVDAISNVGPNQNVTLTIVRNKQTMTLNLVTGSFAPETAAS
jgi:S1-C subfamily serine protease